LTVNVTDPVLDGGPGHLLEEISIKQNGEEVKNDPKEGIVTIFCSYAPRIPVWSMNRGTYTVRAEMWDSHESRVTGFEGSALLGECGGKGWDCSVCKNGCWNAEGK
jgi:hypothetical protein